MYVEERIQLGKNKTTWTQLTISLPSIVCRLCNSCSSSSSSSVEICRLKWLEIEEGFPRIQAMVKPDIGISGVCVCFLLIQLLNVGDDLIVSAQRERKLHLCSSVEVEAMIIIFSFSLDERKRERERGGERERNKKECLKLFHWCMWRVQRTVCCNQQTNIIISRVHIGHEKETLLEAFLFFIASSFRRYSFHCLLDDILI